jgi:hypothetical protein
MTSGSGVNASSLVGAASGGSITCSTTDALLYWSGTAGVCDAAIVTDGSGNVTAVTFTANEALQASDNEGVYSYGSLSFADANLMFTAQGSSNNYIQNVIQNTSSGASASSDYIAANDQGTATTHYGDFGINSSGFSGTGNLTGLAGESYLYSVTGDLGLGTLTANAIHFVANNSAADAATVTSGNVFNFPAAGFSITGATTAGHYLRNNGTNFVDSALQSGDITAACSTCLVSGGALGTPSSGTGTNITGIPLAGLVTVGADTFLANATAGTAAVTAVAMPTTAHGVWLGEGTASAPSITAAGAAGTLLAGAGSSTDPSFSATPTLGVQATTAGALTLAGTTGTSGTITLNGGTSGSQTISVGLSSSEILIPQLSVTAQFYIAAKLACSTTMPTVASGGGGTVAATVTGTDNCSFSINVGTGTITSPIVLTFPAANHGWAVHCDDITTTSTTNFITKQTGSVSTTSVTLTAYTDGALTTGATWTASDILECIARAN